MTESQEARLLHELEELAAKLADEGRAEDGDIVHDASKLLTEQDEREKRIEEGVTPLVRACFREFFGPDSANEPDDSEVALPSSHITFGMVREAWAALYEAPPVEAAADEGEDFGPWHLEHPDHVCDNKCPPSAQFSPAKYDLPKEMARPPREGTIDEGER
jgi:hypothetical protein